MTEPVPGDASAPPLPGPSAEDDRAWVSIQTPFDGEKLAAFLDDAERLFRINSQLAFKAWLDLGEGRFRMTANNLSNGRTVDTELRAERHGPSLRITYAEGLKAATSFAIEAQPGGTANLVVTDDYSAVPRPERKARVAEVDTSLVQWGRDLHRYLHQWHKWSGLPGWKWYMRRVWQPMRPMSRRISFLLIMITLAEFVMFLMVFAVFWLELDKYLNN